MNKKLYFLAAASLVFAACSNEVLVEDIESPEVAIGFDTYSPTMTKADGAENSTSTTKQALETHHESFRVWGYKTVNGTESSVFKAEQEVTATKNEGTLDGNWTYSPNRYWDKSASSYAFYAVAPYSTSWSFDATSKKVKYENFSLGGKTLDVAEKAKNAVDANASFKSLNSTDVDLMLAHDVTGYTSYTSTTVNLEFDHILSRFNIGVAQAKVDEQIYLNSITLYNHKSNGTFDESLAAASTDGSIARWATAPTEQTYYTSGVGYSTSAGVSGLSLTKIAGTTIADSDKFKYVYQGLVIPQDMAFQAVTLDGHYTKESNSVTLDGDAAPYLKIVYTVKYDDTNNETFTYYYNIANMFSKTDKVTFCEGFQNNLNILISPTLIQFDAEVYEWVTKESNDVVVPNN